jgi:pyruvate/2-oxoglutarate dehydrogenase complex dihydrolipoamide dehydrogenase (E3) component
VFARFGACVTVIEALSRLLPAAEPEAGDMLATDFAREGIEVLTGTPPRASAMTAAGAVPQPKRARFRDRLRFLFRGR